MPSTFKISVVALYPVHVVSPLLSSTRSFRSRLDFWVDLILLFVDVCTELGNTALRFDLLSGHATLIVDVAVTLSTSCRSVAV